MKYNNGILGIFSLIWERRNYNSFCDIFKVEGTSIHSCNEMHKNLLRAWMRTTLICIIMILGIWILYYIQPSILTLSFSTLTTLICLAIPIVLWLTFDRIENAIETYVKDLEKELEKNQSAKPITNRNYDDFDLWLGV